MTRASLFSVASSNTSMTRISYERRPFEHSTLRSNAGLFSHLAFGSYQGVAYASGDGDIDLYPVEGSKSLTSLRQFFRRFPTL